MQTLTNGGKQIMLKGKHVAVILRECNYGQAVDLVVRDDGSSFVANLNRRDTHENIAVKLEKLAEQLRMRGAEMQL